MIIFLIAVLIIVFSALIVMGILDGIRQGRAANHKNIEVTRKTKLASDTVYVYPRGKVYHRHPYCSDTQSIPNPMSESIAQISGLHRCTKCWK